MGNAHVANIKVVDLDIKTSFKVSGNLEYFSVLANLVSVNIEGCEDIEGARAVCVWVYMVRWVGI